MLHFPIKIRIQWKNFANSDPDLFQTHTTCLQNFVEILHKLYKKNFSQQHNLPKHLKHIKQKQYFVFMIFFTFSLAFSVQTTGSIRVYMKIIRIATDRDPEHQKYQYNTNAYNDLQTQLKHFKDL